MNAVFDKIKVLWIDDCEGQDAGYLYPENNLSKNIVLGEILPLYFDIIKSKNIPGSSSIRTSDDLAEIFNPFWHKTGHTDNFPPEIIAMDYNLSKWQDTTANVDFYDDEVNDKDILSINTSSANKIVDNSVAHSNDTEIGFEGLILGIFISSLLHRHPIGVVPMTNYGDFLKRTPEVYALHNVSKEVLHIDFSEFGVDGQDRSWDKVIAKGVQALRVRIEKLYDAGEIIIAVDDLMALTESSKHEVITISSPHATRKLPVQGLFIDIDDSEEKNNKIRKWATKLLQSVITKDQFEKATNLSNILWDKYNDDELLNDHFEFSKLHIANSHNSDKYKKLYKKFQPIQKRNALNCSNNCFDIRFGTKKDYSNAERRWAALFLIKKLLKRIIDFIENTGIAALQHDGEIAIENFYPEFTRDDIYLLLFPVPPSPFPLPWHIDSGEKRDDALLNWYRTLERNLDFVPSDIINGTVLSDGERKFMQGLVLGEEQSFEAWKAYKPAKLFLFGPENKKNIGGRGNE